MSKQLNIGSSTSSVDVNVTGSLKLNQEPIVPFHIITTNDVSVETNSTKGSAPYDLKYGYTNITINTINSDKLKDNLMIMLLCSGSLIVAEATKNVRIRLSQTGTYIPVYLNAAIAPGDSCLTNGACCILIYRRDVNTNGAFHVVNAGSGAGDISWGAISDLL